MKSKGKDKNQQEKQDFPGYPVYPPNQDIYSRNKVEADIDPEQPNALKTPNEEPGRLNEKDFKEDVSGSDLDIPGAELDDTQENIGSEDEENNYYSLGDNN